MVLVKGKKRSRNALSLALLVLAILGVLFMSGCAGGTGIAPQAKSYTITVTGKYGSLQHSVPVTLTIE